MTHPKTPLPNDDSWSTGDEGFDLRIRLSLAERDALRARNAELVAALEQIQNAIHRGDSDAFKARIVEKVIHGGER